MGGRGTYANGINVDFRWETIGSINGVKILDLIDKRLSKKLPEESHSSNKYVMYTKKDTFKVYREYDANHNTKFELAYHPEPKLNNGDRQTPILHVHEYKGSIENRIKRLATYEEYIKYKYLLKGVVYNER